MHKIYRNASESRYILGSSLAPIALHGQDRAARQQPPEGATDPQDAEARSREEEGHHRRIALRGFGGRARNRTPQRTEQRDAVINAGEERAMKVVISPENNPMTT